MPKYYVTCKSLYPCGSPLETTKGWEDKLESNVAKAKALLQEAGYDGTPVVLMQSTDIASLSNLAPVAKSLMEKAGLKVDLQAMDWQTLVSRRAKKDPPNAGGWSVFLTSWGGVDVLDPVSTNFLNASCEKATFGWPCDAEIERLRDAFAKETDPVKQKAIARGRVGARRRVPHPRPSRPVPAALGVPQEHHGRAGRLQRRLLEHREEVTRGLPLPMCSSGESGSRPMAADRQSNTTSTLPRSPKSATAVSPGLGA